MDFSEKMVEFGTEAIAASGRDNVQTEVASVLDLRPYAGGYSAVSCVRCLINLTSEAEQFAAIDQLTAALRPGGKLLLIEGLEETFAGMNEARKKAQLPEIQLDWHNRLLSQSSVIFLAVRTPEAPRSRSRASRCRVYSWRLCTVTVFTVLLTYSY